MERAEQPPPRRVARKHAPRAVCPVRSGRQANDQQPRPWIAQAWHRLRPIIPVAELALLLSADPLPLRHESRAQLASNNLLVQLVVPVHEDSGLVRDPFVAKLLDALL